MILGIDPGTNCGWCVMDDAGAVIESGTWKLKAKDGERYGLRFGRFQTLLDETLGTYRPTEIVYELIRRHEGVGAAHVYGGLMALIEMASVTWEIPTVTLEVAAVKQCATGKGNANKAEMVVAAVRKWPDAAIDSDNTADALWVAEARRIRYVAVKKAKAAKAAKGKA